MVNFGKCFGKPGSMGFCCRCRYRESCQLYADTETDVNSHLGIVNYDEIADFREDAAVCDPEIEEQEQEEEGERSEELLSRMAEFFRYLLDLDNYTLALISKMIAPGEADRRVEFIADLNRGVSRHATYKNLFRIVQKHPELACLFRGVCGKIARARTEYEAKAQKKQEQKTQAAKKPETGKAKTVPRRRNIYSRRKAAQP